ncbi:hypothetical protein LTR17_015221 [Elasticomyces elasticus]|nr:hypothetical protein LTR17_015221 [Elasticomyces elasticus]
MAGKMSLKQLSANVQKAVEAYETNDGDAAAYDHALEAIQKLQLAVEKPGDYAARVRYRGLQNIAIVMLAEMGVLQAIAARPDSSITASELAKETSCDELLIKRLLRQLTTNGICDEVAEYTYASNPMTQVFASPGQLAGFRYSTEQIFYIGSKIRGYLQESQVHKSQPVKANAHQHAFGKTFWQLLASDPSAKENFDIFMKAARRGGHVQMWNERYPPVSQLKDEDLKTGAEAVLMVDVGGGVGGQVGAFRKQCPDLPGRCILQDLPDTIKNNTSPPEGVELQAYDFFTPQPVKGARIYLFRSVCHDWDDSHSRKLLANTVAAMDPEYSRLLIDDWVLPDLGASLKATNMDINMMIMFDAMERTKNQWIKLLADVGLEIVEIYSTPGAAESIIETRVKRSRVI